MGLFASYLATLSALGLALGLVLGGFTLARFRISPGDSVRGMMGETGKGDTRPRSIGEAGNGEMRPRWARGIGSDMSGTDMLAEGAPTFMTSDSDAERTACLGAATGTGGSSRVGGGPAEDGEGGGRPENTVPLTFASSADIGRGE